MDRIVWQPEDLYGERYGFTVSLDRAFASEMLSCKIDQSKQRRLNELANEFMKEKRRDWSSPYSFKENSCLLSVINIGSNGTWLEVDHYAVRNIEKSKDPVKYHSHNVDNCHQRDVLLSLFDMWAKYADVIKGKSE